MEVYIIKETQNYKNGNQRVNTLTKCFSDIENAIITVDSLVIEGMKGIEDMVFSNDGIRFQSLPNSIHSNICYERKIMKKDDWNVNIIYEINKYEL